MTHKGNSTKKMKCWVKLYSKNSILKEVNNKILSQHSSGGIYSFNDLKNNEEAYEHGYKLHKIPIESGWQGKEHSTEEADGWVKKGFGVGINLMKLEGICLIDIDVHNEQDEEEAEKIANYFGMQGALVMETRRGYHIFFRRKDGMPNRDIKNCIVTTDFGASISCEYYAGASARNVVMPVRGTPREYFKGQVIYASKNPKGECVSIFELEELFEELLERPAEIGGFALLDASIKDKFRISKQKSEEWSKFLNKEWYLCTKSDLLNLILSQKEGSRHNNVLKIAYIWKARGFSDWDMFRKACAKIWKGEKGWEKEVDNIIKWVEEKVVSLGAAVVYNDSVVFAQTESAEKKNGDSEDLFDQITNTIFGGDVKAVEHLGKRYILYKNEALNTESFIALCYKKGIKLSEYKAKMYINSLFLSHSTNFEKVFFVSHNLTYDPEKGFYVAAIYNNEKGVLFAGSNELKFVKSDDLEGFYFLPNTKFRDVTKILDDPHTCSNVLLESFATFFEDMTNRSITDSDISDKTKAYIAGVLAAGTPISRSILFVLGRSGSGKTTLLQVLKSAIDGHVEFVRPKDARDVIAASTKSSVLLIDENSIVDGDASSLINMIITNGSLAARALFTDNDTVKNEARVNVCIASTDIDVKRDDVFRRAFTIRLKPIARYNKADEDTLMRSLEKSKDVLLVGYMNLVKGFANNSNSVHLINKVLKGEFNHNITLPSWLGNITKVDIARAYHYFCNLFNVPEDVQKIVWNELRYGNVTGNPEVWKVIVNKYLQDSAFREKVNKGMPLKDLVNEIINDVMTTSKFIGKKKETVAGSLYSYLPKSVSQNSFILDEHNLSVTFKKVKVDSQKNATYIKIEDRNKPNGGDNGGDNGGGDGGDNGGNNGGGDNNANVNNNGGGNGGGNNNANVNNNGGVDSVSQQDISYMSVLKSSPSSQSEQPDKIIESKKGGMRVSLSSLRTHKSIIENTCGIKTFILNYMYSEQNFDIDKKDQYSEDVREQKLLIYHLISAVFLYDLDFDKYFRDIGQYEKFKQNQDDWEHLAIHFYEDAVAYFQLNKNMLKGLRR